jgi:uncharacterized protein YbjT (DUF2867 family)
VSHERTQVVDSILLLLLASSPLVIHSSQSTNHMMATHQERSESDTNPIVLVIGGTGMLGRPVVERIANTDGYFRVRILSRHASHHCSSPSSSSDNGASKIIDDSKNTVEHVQGNVQDEDSLLKAMNGCIGVHINLSGGALEREGAEMVAKVASRVSSLRRITMISGVTTNAENAKRFASTKAKWDAEQAITAACEKSNGRISFTIFRCTMFLETLPKWKYLIGDQTTTKWHWLAAEDYARMVSNSYQDLVLPLHKSDTASAQNQIYFLHGPGPARTLPEAIYEVFLPRIKNALPEGSTNNVTTSVTSIPKWWAWILQYLPWASDFGMATDGTAMRRDEWSSLIVKMDWLSQIQEMGDPSDANVALHSAPSITMEEWIDDYLRQLSSKSNESGGQ